jgi:hypothetical protein
MPEPDSDYPVPKNAIHSTRCKLALFFLFVDCIRGSRSCVSDLANPIPSGLCLGRLVRDGEEVAMSGHYLRETSTNALLAHAKESADDRS